MFAARSISAVVVFGVATACTGDATQDGPPLEVVSTDPADGALDVYLDQVVRVVFSHDLDTSLPSDAVVVEDALGEAVAGRVTADRRTLLFTPARFAAETAHTIRVSADVSGGGVRLGEAFGASFTTGTSTSELANPPPVGFDPLGPGHQIPLGKRPEYAMVFGGIGASTQLVIEDPPYNPQAPGQVNAVQLASQTLTSVLEEKLPIAAQLDDDGEDEIAVISWSETEAPILTIFERDDGGTWLEHTPAISFAFGASVDVAVADFDADGRDEILVGVSKPDERIRYHLVDYDETTESYTMPFDGPVGSDDSMRAAYVQVAAGDVDGDGRAEAVIAWHIHDTDASTSDAYYVVHDDATAGMAEVFPFRPIREEIPLPSVCHDPYVELAVGDVDGDPADEILFGLTQHSKTGGGGLFYNYKTQCRMVDTLLVADNFTVDAPVSPEVVVPEGGEVGIDHFWYPDGAVARGANVGRIMPLLVTADLDGDLRDEVLLHDLVFKFPAGAGVLSFAENYPVSLPTTVIDTGPYASAWNLLDLAPGWLTRSVSVGDVDGDLAEDVVLLRQHDGTVWVDHFDYVDGGVVVDDPILSSNQLEHGEDYALIDGHPLLALPNVDEDSIIVEPSGHDVYLADNIILAVLVAPPCSAEIGQDPDECSTEFGQGTTMSWTHGAYVNASAGVIVGFEFEPTISLPLIDVKITKLEVEASFGVEGSYQHSWSNGVSELFSFSASGDNLVIFKSHVYDRYHYEVIQHPDAARIGEHIMISMPSGQRLMAVSQEYYNLTNGEQMDIDERVVTVVPGDLSTYPDSTGADAIMSGQGNEIVSKSSATVPAPEGENFSSAIELGVSSGGGDEYSIGLYLNASAKVCTPDASGWNPSVCGGVESSISGGYAHAHEWSNELVFAGSIVGIPREQFGANAYSAGLFAYKTTVANEGTGEEQSFIVVSYYLE